MARGGRVRPGDRERRAQLSPLGRRVARWLPALLIVVGIVFELVTPARFTASPFFSAAPLVAAPLYSLRNTALTALAALLGELGAALFTDAQDTNLSATEVSTVFVVAVLALGINRVVRLSDARLASVRDVSEAAQRAVLPTPPERVGGLAVAARYVGAQADARIGGDLYAVQETPHGVRLIVGDVRGKGLEAVEAAVIVIGAFREAAEQEATLEAVAGRLERALQREGRRREGLDQYEGFTTAVLAEIPSGERAVLRVLNRGHPPPLLLAPDGGLRTVVPAVHALPLGMSEVAGWPDRADEMFFPAGAVLLLYTDGLTEARNRAGEFYDPVARLRGRAFPGPDRLLDTLVAEVARHTGGAGADDMALLAVQRPLEE
ncbi:PP2C family protein-serine/threonine phosphatase [Streptomyces benahoarensis]|uniref:SpoIIE family protein phosphatase n=1 Tax=Streptomyces benahoarensis TaxID=2595054 RepID=A0A553YUQ0_9ACTN|nr:PP2C family protein-serine/threonine phosphatase [Streptomyces benahoarensis]TSB17563.1 SpoIIE family protein phosphatase [Streptomyces benahoarensis]TSB32927.1 SpoIIE family protein phosphatase [Streptomyces benahoarensis]